MLDDYTPKELPRATTIPARWYLDPALLELESAAVFARTWQPIGHARAVAEPGSYLAGEIAGEPVVVTRAFSAASLSARTPISVILRPAPHNRAPMDGMPGASHVVCNVDYVTPPWGALAGRESAELRAESVQMGYSLARLLTEIEGVPSTAPEAAFYLAVSAQMAVLLRMPLGLLRLPDKPHSSVRALWKALACANQGDADEWAERYGLGQERIRLFRPTMVY